MYYDYRRYTIYLLPYTGAGSGIQRALSEEDRLTFSNNESLHEFVITIARKLGADSDTFDADSNTKEQYLGADSDTKNLVKLNKKQKDVINYCNIPRSSKEILERVGISYHSKNIEKYINILVGAGYLEMTNPENPNASNQKYRKIIKK